MSSRNKLPLVLWITLLNLFASTPLWADEDQALERNVYLQQQLGDALGHFRNAVEEMHQVSTYYVNAETCNTRFDLKKLELQQKQSEGRVLHPQIAHAEQKYKDCQQELDRLETRAQSLSRQILALLKDPPSSHRQMLCDEFDEVRAHYSRCNQNLSEIARSFHEKSLRLYHQILPEIESLKQEVGKIADEVKQNLRQTRLHLEQAIDHYNQGLGLLRTYQDGLEALRQDANRWKVDFDWAKDMVCFPADTLIWTENGRRDIATLVDEYDPESPINVYACDVNNGTCRLKPVTAVYQSSADQWVEIHYSQDSRIQATENHPIYTEHGYLTAGEIAKHLNSGERIRVQVARGQGDLEFIEVHKAEIIQCDKPMTVYNLEVEGLETYFVGSLPLHVHNCSLNRMVQTITSNRQLMCGGLIAVCAGTALGSATLVTGSLAAGPVGAVAGSSVRTLAIGEMNASCTAAVAICGGALNQLHSDIRDDLVLNKKKSNQEKKYQSKSDAFGAAKRDLGIPKGQQPDVVKSLDLQDKWGNKVLDCNGRVINTREYHYTRADGSKVVIQEHSAGHKFGQGGVGDQGPHYNVRPYDPNTGNGSRNGSVAGTKDHYSY
ncbi:MAG: HNH/endonuclease VII fold putative polymorphic toxin [Zetaproteobacteria bacterium]|nr:HNH/endonuclease VII fold putative polymorphic toxin [Zetaproteobacteria bacterium]